MSGSWAWQEHNGVRYLVLDYRGLDDEQATALLLESVEVIKARSRRGCWSWFTATARLPSVEHARLAMELGRTVYRPLRTRMAILGLPAVAVMGLRTFNAVAGGNRAALFRDEEQALRFLVAGATTVSPVCSAPPGNRTRTPGG